MKPASFVNWLVSVGIETVEFVHSPNPLSYVKNCPSDTDVIFTSAKSSIVNPPKSTLLPVEIDNVVPESDNVCESVSDVKYPASFVNDETVVGAPVSEP